MITYNDILNDVYNVNALDEVRQDVQNQVDKLIDHVDQNPDMDMMSRHNISIALDVYEAVLDRIKAQYQLIEKKQSTQLQAELN
tara:strand:- start:255 stop:506 length:252 start_codon:yes stop_codon:yes gene_type:complete